MWPKVHRNILRSVDETLRLLDHPWGRIEATKGRGAFLSQDIGRSVRRVRVAKSVFETLKRSALVEHSPSETYFKKREIVVISALGKIRIRGTRRLALVRKI
jgi:hypothetical protein